MKISIRSIAVIVFVLISTPAFADNCGSLGDCYGTVQSAAAVVAGISTAFALALLLGPLLIGLGEGGFVALGIAGAEGAVVGEGVSAIQVAQAGAAIAGAIALMKHDAMSGLSFEAVDANSDSNNEPETEGDSKTGGQESGEEGDGAGEGGDKKPPKPEPPPLPEGMKDRGEFGEKMRWGRNNAEARARIKTLTRDELEDAGVTRKIAEEWRDMYRWHTKYTTNPKAAGRADLMQRAVELLTEVE